MTGGRGHILYCCDSVLCTVYEQHLHGQEHQQVLKWRLKAVWKCRDRSEYLLYLIVVRFTFFFSLDFAFCFFRQCGMCNIICLFVFFYKYIVLISINYQSFVIIFFLSFSWRIIICYIFLIFFWRTQFSSAFCGLILFFSVFVAIYLFFYAHLICLSNIKFIFFLSFRYYVYRYCCCCCFTLHLVSFRYYNLKWHWHWMKTSCPFSLSVLSIACFACRFFFFIALIILFV